MIGIAEAPQPGDDKDSLLNAIGVTEAECLTALAAGDAAAASCTANHPPMAPGFYRFAETVAALALQKGEDGWTRHDYKNFSTVVSPKGQFAIAVASGDGGTGDLSASVTTRSPKGVTTEEAIDVNLTLPFDDRCIAENQKLNAQPPASEKAQPTTFFLLHDRRDGVRYAELSCPQSIDHKGYVTKWFPRIALAASPLDPAKLTVESQPPINPIVDVKPRGA
jgi:hypothetical protein